MFIKLALDSLQHSNVALAFSAIIPVGGKKISNRKKTHLNDIGKLTLVSQMNAVCVGQWGLKFITFYNIGHTMEVRLTSEMKSHRSASELK